MPYIADRVQTITVTTGTGTLTLAGAVAGYQSFASAFPTDCPAIQYLIVSGVNWETGIGAFKVSSNTLTRNPQTSSNSNGLINLSGTSSVYCTASASFLDNANIGLIYAQARGFAMP